MIRKIWRTITAVAASVLLLAACTTVEPRPVTWQDVAETIPSDCGYVVSVNVKLAEDTTLNNIWADAGVQQLVCEGLALDTVKPSHLVVVSQADVTYVIWPLADPIYAAGKVADWETASLNNTVDAHVKAVGNTSIVVSSTQVWVVNHTHGAEYVNNLIGAAMNTKAGHVVPYADCITSVPAMINAVIHDDGKYYAIELNHEDGLVRVDADAYTKLGKRIDVADGLGQLPIEFVSDISEVSPFAAVEIERGTLPGLLKRMARVLRKPELQLGVAVLTPALTDVQGTVLATWTGDEMKVRLPYANREAALVADRHIRTLIKKSGLDVKVKHDGANVVISTPHAPNLPVPDRDRATPHVHSQTENPSVVAFARVDIGHDDPAELYFELSSSHARLQVDFKQSAENTDKAVALVKRVLFREL